MSRISGGALCVTGAAWIIRTQGDAFYHDRRNTASCGRLSNRTPCTHT